jgi:hypothetical protein
MVIHTIGKDPIPVDTQIKIVPRHCEHKANKVSSGRHDGGQYLAACQVVQRWLDSCMELHGPCPECRVEGCCVKEYDRHQDWRSPMKCAVSLMVSHDLKLTRRG